MTGCLTAVRRARRARRRMLVASMLLAFALPVYAQEPPRPERPYRGLFGGARPDPKRYQSLDLSVSLLGGYDDNVTADARGGGRLGDPRFGASGGLATATASLSYRKVRNDNSFFAGARSGFRYYTSLSELNAADYGASLGFSARPTRRSRIAGNQDVAYLPFLSLAAVPVFSAEGDAGLPVMTIEQAILERPSINYSSRVDGSYDVTRRTHLSAGYSFRGFDFTRASEEGRLRRHGARLGVARDVSRRVALGGRYTYDYSDGSYLGPPILTRGHGGAVTFDYRRTLRSRRQLGFGFASGYSRFESDRLQAQRRIDYRATGSASLFLDLGRTWTTRADYHRGLRHLPGVPEPVFSDSVQAQLSGLIGRRIDVSFLGQYSNRADGLGRSNSFDTMSGSAQARWAVNRMTALSASYVYYRYEFGPDATLPEGIGRRLNRHGFRVGVDVWLPLYR